MLLDNEKGILYQLGYPGPFIQFENTTWFDIHWTVHRIK